ncbi:MAG: nicotinamide mononucleotide transporter [Acidobacteriales bacterium]|nr:nicotinamide mononucleotide transporter [Terriglobales bacterium]
MGFELNWLEIWGFITGAVCVGLQVKQNIWNWPIGITNNVLYIVVFFRSGLYADCGLQVVYIIISVYGLWSWRLGGEQHSELKISRVTRAHGIYIALTTAFSVLVIAWLLKTQTNSNVPWGDATTTSLSLAAQYMMSRKILENWFLWNFANVISIALFIYKGLYLTSFLYFVFFVMCVAGFIRWRQELTAPPLAAAAAV